MPTPLPTTINEVIKRLDLIINETIQANNHLGIFAYIYRRTTAKIQESILQKRFEDNPRMEKFDVIFANRYLEAYENFKLQQPISKSWQTAFDAKDSPLTIIQHLTMGMNAHISFDLGLAAAAVTSATQIELLKSDFMLINQILQEIINEMQGKINKVSRLMFLLDWVGKRTDEEVINFGIVKSRQFAWNLALGVAALKIDETAKQTLIQKTDNTVASLNLIIQRPPSFLGMVLRLISFFETKDVGKIIEKLKG